MTTEDKCITRETAQAIAERAKKAKVELPKSELFHIKWKDKDNRSWFMGHKNYFGRMLKNKIIEFPAYSWQEILIEHPKAFFGEKCADGCNNKHCRSGWHIPEKKWMSCSQKILSLLQQNKKEEAEKYLLDNLAF